MTNGKEEQRMFKKLKAGFESLKAGLARTHNSIMGSVEAAFTGKSREDILEALEESLILSDVGVKAASEIVDKLREELAGKDEERLKELLKDYIYDILKKVERPLEVTSSPFVIMVLGVNGVGKTTTIGKLAARYSQSGKSVILAAGDTFRAAAIEQLEGWGQRAGCPVIRQSQGGDPGAVVYDAMKAAITRHSDIIILAIARELGIPIRYVGVGETVEDLKEFDAREFVEALI